MIELTEEEQYKHYIVFEDAKNNYIKVRDHCHYTGKYRGAAHKICNLMYNTPREISVIFHNGSTYDYHFIIKGLAEEFDGEVEYLGEKKEKYISFSVQIKKESNEDETIIYIKFFFDSFRFMSTSLSSLVNNLSGGIHNRKCNNCSSNLEYIYRRENGKIILKCFNCEKKYSVMFNEKLGDRFKNIYDFCNKDIHKFMLLLRKGIYPYEYI